MAAGKICVMSVRALACPCASYGVSNCGGIAALSLIRAVTDRQAHDLWRAVDQDGNVLDLDISRADAMRTPPRRSSAHCEIVSSVEHRQSK